MLAPYRLRGPADYCVCLDVAQCRSLEAGACDVCGAQAGDACVDAAQSGARQVRVAEVGVAEVATGQDRASQGGSA